MRSVFSPPQLSATNEALAALSRPHFLHESATKRNEFQVSANAGKRSRAHQRHTTRRTTTMFTIKMIDGTGEYAVEATSYRITRGDDCDRLMTFDKPHDDGNYTALFTGRLQLAGSTLGSPDCFTIYIVNRFGATVATHRFEKGFYDQGIALAA